MIANPHLVTRHFEQALADYTGAPFVVTVDSCSSALFLALYYENMKNVKGQEVTIPSRTYMSVPCALIQCGYKVKFEPVEGTTITGEYNLKGTRVWDSALRLTGDMFRKGQVQCLSFSGAYKHLCLGKGGAILTDDALFYSWAKKARFSGRNEVSYHEDVFTQLGWNMYLLPELAAHGLLLMNGFYNLDGSKKQNQDKTLPYPDLSTHPAYKCG